MEVSASAFIPPPPLGRQDSEGETSGVTRSQGIMEYSADGMKSITSDTSEWSYPMLHCDGALREFLLILLKNLWGQQSSNFTAIPLKKKPLSTD
ncbi:hypothetical protein TNCV_2072771 [Trichonephila clavipes]|nr:hypothetical protein TNCV_2072771 [Trichonephila clavipes]